jgi:Spy/CpxP family protein refolding chaperone
MRVVSFKTVAATLAAAALVQTGFAIAGADPTAVGFSQRHGILSERVHQQLNLTPDLENQWQQLKTQQTALHNSMRESHQQMRTVLDAEMAKPQPDLTAINNAIDAAHEANYAAQKHFRQTALALYSALTPERQAIVIAALKAKHQRVQDWQKRHPHPRRDSQSNS